MSGPAGAEFRPVGQGDAMRKLLGTLPLMASALVLAACEPTVPDRPGGVGFGDYQSYMAERASGQTGGAAPAQGYGSAGMGAGMVSGGAAGAPMNATDLQPAPLTTPIAGAAPSVAPGAPLPASILAAVNQVDGGGADTAGMIPTEVPSADLRLDPTGQNGGYAAQAQSSGQFPAAPDVMSVPVATPMAAQARPAPVASGAKGAELVDYALSVSNAVGQAVWPRGSVKMANHERACAKYPGNDLAQAAFLKRGGPERDPLNLDPDGDGFACAWDPRPFQQARK